MSGAVTAGGPDISGRVALVTGSSRGIGRAVAQRLASAGATVIVTGRSLDEPVAGKRGGAERVVPGTLRETVALIEAAGGKATAIAANIEDMSGCRDLIGKAAEAGGGRLDILVNNAGYADFAGIADMNINTFERTLTHCLRAPFVLAQAAIPLMRRGSSGWIINIGSQDALRPARPFPDHEKTRGYHVYAAAKAGLHRLTLGMAAELIDDNIAVNMVAPSTAIRTPGSDDMIPAEFPTEDVAYLAETVLAMCHLPAAQRTGLLAFSMHFPYYHAIHVHCLDGRHLLPRREPPPWSHPDINPSGE